MKVRKTSEPDAGWLSKVLSANTVNVFDAVDGGFGDGSTLKDAVKMAFGDQGVSVLKTAYRRCVAKALKPNKPSKPEAPKVELPAAVRSKKSGGLYSVTGEDGDFYIVHPYGGGFQGKLKKTETEPAEVDFKYVPQTAVADFIEGEYPCVADPDNRWNGWAVPWFEKPVLDRIVADTNKMSNSDLQYKQTPTELLLVDPNDYENSNQVSKATINGKEYYTIDGWCWNLKSDWED